MTFTDCVLAGGFLGVIWALCWFQLAIAEARAERRIQEWNDAQSEAPDNVIPFPSPVSSEEAA